MQSIPSILFMSVSAMALILPTCVQSQIAPQAALPTDTDDVKVVVVDARKRNERITDVPATVISFSALDLRDYGIVSFTDYATKTSNLSFAYGNGATAGDPATAISNARTVAIRGVAGARTTGFYMDDTPLPGAVDVRIIDLQDIEVLKGPQGTLYGEGSLGGNIKLVTRAPNLVTGDARIALSAGHTQDGGAPLNGSVEAAGNIVLAPDTLAVRIVGYSDSNAGYLSRNYLSNLNDPNSARISVDNQGAEKSSGASITALLRISQDLDLSLRLLHQELSYNGFPAAYAPLPEFMPVDLLDHTANIQPAATDNWTLPSFTLVWHASGWTVTSSTSEFTRKTSDLEDSTEGTAQYWETTVPQGFAWSSHHNDRQFSHETRLTIDPVGKWSGTVGLFYSRDTGTFSIDPLHGLLGPAPGVSSLLWQQTDINTRRDMALFGELYYQLADTVALTVGDRRYWMAQSDNQSFAILDTAVHSETGNSESGHSPRLALSWKPSLQALAYASAAQGFRAGGSQFSVAGFGCDASLAEIGQTAESITKIQPDKVTSYEVGGKLDFPEPGLLLSGALFRIDWDHIQQPIFLPSCGFYVQGNAGAARINGAEMELDGRINSNLKMRFGLGYEDARITSQGATGQQVGSRIYQTPEWTANLGAVYTPQTQ